MTRIKDTSPEEQKETLTEIEWNYLKVLNNSLQLHTLKDRIISGFLYYVANTRFGYDKDTNLNFELDLDDDKREIKIRKIPQELVDQAMSQQSTPIES